MKISIITVCFNSEKTIKDTIESVLKQSYKNYEYIIVDGKSSDNTLNIVKSYEKKFKGKLRYISEKDKGLYDAFNKGIKMATGDIVGIINSDDILHDNDVFNKISQCDLSKYDGIYGDLVMYDQTLKIPKSIYIGKPGNYKLGWYPQHPTLYVKKSVFEKYGFYKLDYKIAADYDFIIRILKNNVKLFYIDSVIVSMREGGASSGSLKKYMNANKEVYRVLKTNGIKFPLLVTLFRFIDSVFHRIKTLFIHKHIN